MSSGVTGDTYPEGGPEGSMSEEELRAAYEAEIKQIRIEQVLLEQVVSLVNLGMRRTGLQPGTEDERDLGQVQLAIESVRALLPLIEQTAAPQAAQVRDALSQMQLAFVRLGGSAQAAGVPGGAGVPAGPTADPPAGPAGATPAGPGSADRTPGPAGPQAQPPAPGEAGPGGPAQRSGRLWIPGQ